MLMLTFKDCRNPVLPVNYHIPDPEAHVMSDGRVYVYGSLDLHDDMFCSTAYHVISSHNMVDWVDHGVSFQSKDVEWIYNEVETAGPVIDFSNLTPFLKKMIERDTKNGKLEIPKFPKDFLFAPDAIQKNESYYLYFCTSGNKEGVAIADKPTGPFHNPIPLPCSGIDPAVFIDKDGQAYYFWGQFYAHAAKLKENMVEFEENSIVYNLITEQQHFFHEGSSIRRRGDLYYFVYSSIVRGKPTSLAYATSHSPLGPFEYRGVIIDNERCDPSSWNNHGSIEEVNGQWYVFYHRCSRRTKQWRRLCIEPIYFNEDGTIQEVVMTSQGAGRPFVEDEDIEAYRACELKGNVYIAPIHAELEGLTGISEGDEAVFRYVEWDSSVNNISVTATGSGLIEIILDDDDDRSGYVLVADGVVITSSISAIAGKHEVKLQFTDVKDLQLISLRFATY